MSLLDLLRGSPTPVAFEMEPKPVDPTQTLHIAVLAVQFKDFDRVALQWAWAAGGNETFALGEALKQIHPEGVVIGKTVIKIPVADDKQ